MKANKLILSALSAMALAAQAFAQDSTATNAAATKPAGEERPAAEPLRDGEKGLRLNFRGAPLEQVLNYMSDAAGFIINVLPNTDIKGKVDVWSNQPLDKEEAVQLLNTILHQNGLAAIRTGRTLSIISRDTAKTNKDVPVKVEANPKNIPRSDEMVTQIIPVKYVNAAALVQNLQPGQFSAPPLHGFELARRGGRQGKKGMDPRADAEGAGATFLNVEAGDFNGRHNDS